MFRAEVERHSVGPDGQELVTFVIEVAKCTLAEVVTHRANSDSWGTDFAHCERTTTRDISKSSASSRAIPYSRFVEKVVTDPYIPDWIGAKKGMQGDRVEADQTRRIAEAIWLRARADMLFHAEALDMVGVHKSQSNRLLEPFAFVTQVVTATRPNWANFFALRCHEMADPAFRAVARLMFLALKESVPDKLDYDQWHLPFVPRDEALAVRWEPLGFVGWRDFPAEVRRSVARCAWASYENAEKDASQEAADRTCERLLSDSPPHVSPAEHQGNPDTVGCPSGLSGNLSGWIQLRKLLPHERTDVYEPTPDEVAAWPESTMRMKS